MRQDDLLKAIRRSARKLTKDEERCSVPTEAGEFARLVQQLDELLMADPDALPMAWKKKGK
jgi:hypothetical protein